MSRALSLIPVEYDHGGDGHSFTVLRLPENYDLFDAIEAAGFRETDAPEKFNTYLGRGKDGEHGFGQTSEDPYGEPLRCVRAGALASLRNDPQVQAEPLSRAVWAYLAELPPNTKVALYWS